VLAKKILLITLILLALPSTTFDHFGAYQRCYKVRIEEAEQGTILEDVYYPCFCREVEW